MAYLFIFAARKYDKTLKEVTIYSGVSFTSALGAFVYDSLAEISIWLIVMFWVILADLFAGCYKIYKRGEKLRVSKGLRDTMGKFATYFAFVVAIVFVSRAANFPLMPTYACLAVIAGEGLSITSNILKSHGYSLNITALMKMLGKKVGVEGEDIIQKE